ncbi:MAG: hypothetical protein JWM19_6954 [Actinomycetia bacterium]|nr:hypothetical protein [Actinomycetes bacterium]
MNTRRPRLRSLVVAAAAASCLALTACSNSSSSASSSATTPASSAASSSSSDGSAPAIPASLTGTAKTVATNWVGFFDPRTPTATKVTLLQNGTTFESVLAAQASSASARQTSVTVSAVTVSGPTAAVTWTLDLSGVPALTGQKGLAVLTKGVWQVSDASFCGLLSLQPPAPAACKS